MKHDDAEIKYRALFEQSPYGILVIDTEGRFLDFNETAYRDLGYTREEFANLTIADIDPIETPAEIQARINRILKNGRAEFEVRHRTKQGQMRDVQIIIQALTLSGQTVLHTIWCDITQRKRAEDALRRNEEFTRNILDNIDEGFLVVDRDFRIMAANRTYCAWGDAPGGTIVGRRCHEVSHRTARPCHEEGVDCSVQRAFETGKPHAVIHKHEDYRGNIMYVETKAFPLRDSAGAVTAAVETIQNITERRLLEAEQLKTQKLEAIGRLAGGIAHDFNNLLHGMFGYISMARANLEQKEKAGAMLDKAGKALNMSVSLTNQLLTFSKGGRPVMKNIALNAVIESSANFALSGSRSDCLITLDDNLWRVEADEGQVAQVIRNIVLNANEAMPDGGIVEIAARNTEIISGSTPSLPGGGKFVKISVKDKGVGIPEQYLPRIFDPYFTTKQRGSGLGLAASYSIIRNHGGGIEVESEVSRGSTFSVYLPAGEAQEEELPAPTPAQARKGKILVMDDEDIIRSVVRTMIESLGHAVECAASGEEALDVFSRAMNAGKPFNVVILDLTVKGGMGGEQAVVGIRAMDPAVKAVVSSGYADNPAVSDYRSYGFDAFLSKPYMIDALKDTLNALLG